MLKNPVGSLKSRVILLGRQIKSGKRQLEKLTRREKCSRNVWTKAYHTFMKSVNQLADLKRHGTKKELGLKGKIRSWPAETVKLTKERDEVRTELKALEQKLVALETERTMILEQQFSEIKTIDEIVTQVFALNAAVVRAASDREQCLNRHVFPRLIDEHGDLRSQISFTSSDGLRRVVAMVNTMTIVRGDLAAEAKVEIKRFFDRFQEAAKMDETVRPLYELTRQLLVEKTDFKVGPDLYRFLAMDLDDEIYPELSKAQTLLRLSIRSEKTTSYIRIYKRQSQASKWEILSQS